MQFEILINCFFSSRLSQESPRKKTIASETLGILLYVGDYRQLCTQSMYVHVVHIPVSFIFWDVIQVLNFVHLDFLLLGML